MPPQASANKQKEQAFQPNQLASGGYGSPDTPPISASINKVEIQESQSVEDGSFKVTSRKTLAAQVDSSIACFTVGRPPLYAGAGEDVYDEEETETTRVGIAQDPATREDVTTYQPTSTIPLPKRCAVRAIAGSVLCTRRPGKEKTPSKAVKASSTVSGNPVETFPSTSKLSIHMTWTCS